MTNELSQPILEGGINSIHFFNGRLLSGEDLSQEQTANRQARELLGQALGDGVACGLDVKPTQGVSTKQSPVITVQAGVAVNRLGQALCLPAPQNIAVARPPQEGTGPITGLFAECRPLNRGEYVAGAGVYLLTIRPVSGPNGRAPVSGLGNLDAACNARYQVAGVQFRLIQVPLGQGALNDARLRNQLAHRCFGTSDPDVGAFLANPFGPIVSAYGLLDDLRPACLKDDEVPLALLFWTAADGLKFVDMWSVRRRITHPAGDAVWPVQARTAPLPADAAWSLLRSDRRAAEAEAAFLQFQEHVAAMRSEETNLGTIRASDRFEYLPPAGLLPVRDTRSPGGFNWSKFFGPLAPDSLDVTDAALVPFLIRASFQHQPFSATDTALGRITLYRIRENVDAVQAGTANQLAIVFARPGIPYSGVPRLDYAAWDVSHFV